MELRMEKLTRQYGKKTAIDHLDSTLNAGVYGLLGSNGAGKTTLMRMLCGILRPTSYPPILYRTSNTLQMIS